MDMYGKRRRQEREVTVPVNVAVPAVIAVLTRGKFRCVIVSCTVREMEASDKLIVRPFSGGALIRSLRMSACVTCGRSALVSY